MKWEFMNTYEELHAFIIGWGQGVSFWCKRAPMPMEYKSPLEEEYHYYAFGYGVGILTLMFGVVGAIKLVLGG